MDFRPSLVDTWFDGSSSPMGTPLGPRSLVECDPRSAAMEPVARSVRVWGFYALAMGLALMAVPQVLFAILLVPASDEPWVRLVGVLAVAIGVYYLGGARSVEVAPFAGATVVGRLVVTAGITIVAVVGGFWLLLLVAGVDQGGAGWAYSEARRTPGAAEPHTAG
jgi:hypothetical protein